MCVVIFCNIFRIDKTPLAEVLIESGIKEQLKSYLRLKLEECGWNEEMRASCVELLNSGPEDASVDWLISEITPHAVSTIPLSVKIGVLTKIREFLCEYSKMTPNN